mgnify:CR=1 FL=1
MRRGITVSLSLLILAAAAGTAQAPSPWLWSPYLGSVGTGFIAISWRTARPVTVDLSYARIGQGEAVAAWDETLTFEKQEGVGEVWLQGLIPGATYRYQITAYEGAVAYPAPPGTFTLPNEDLPSFTFLVYGETRLLADRHQLVADAMAEGEPDAAFTLHVGDLVEEPDTAQYTNLFWSIARLAGSRPYLPVHDDARRAGERYYEVFALPLGGGEHDEQWWSFDYGCVHVIGLDSTAGASGEDEVLRRQTAWLRDDLATATAAGRIVVVCAAGPLYGACASATSQTLRDAWEALFHQYGVGVVLSGGAGGYEHIYQDGIHFVVTAGGGGPLESSTCEAAAATVLRRDNALHYVRVTVCGRTLRVDAIPVAFVTAGDVVPTPNAEPMDSFIVGGN